MAEHTQTPDALCKNPFARNQFVDELDAAHINVEQSNFKILGAGDAHQTRLALKPIR
jgi:hypothetical protein